MELFLEITKILSIGSFLLMSILIVIVLGATAIDFINKHFK